MGLGCCTGTGAGVLPHPRWKPERLMGLTAPWDKPRTDPELKAAIVETVVEHDTQNRVDSATRTAIENSVQMDRPVVAPTTVEALTWVGVGYAIIGVVLIYIPDMLAMLNLPENAKWVIPLVLGVTRIVDRMVRYKVQQGAA